MTDHNQALLALAAGARYFVPESDNFKLSEAVLRAPVLTVIYVSEPEPGAIYINAPISTQDINTFLNSLA